MSAAASVAATIRADKYFDIEISVVGDDEILCNVCTVPTQTVLVTVSSLTPVGVCNPFSGVAVQYRSCSCSCCRDSYRSARISRIGNSDIQSGEDRDRQESACEKVS